MQTLGRPIGRQVRLPSESLASQGTSDYDDHADAGMAMTVKVIIMMMVIMIIPTMRMKTLVKNMVMMVMVV